MEWRVPRCPGWCLTIRSRRTASPPLNSGVRALWTESRTFKKPKLLWRMRAANWSYTAHLFPLFNCPSSSQALSFFSHTPSALLSTLPSLHPYVSRLYGSGQSLCVERLPTMHHVVLHVTSPRGCSHGARQRSAVYARIVTGRCSGPNHSFKADGFAAA